MSVDLISLGEALAVPVVAIFSILYARSAITTALKTQLKTTAVEKIFETMGFRNFKMTDLNMNKIDDTGFNRFRILLYDIGKIYGSGAGPEGGAVAKSIQEIKMVSEALGSLGLQNAQKKEEKQNQFESGIPA